MRPLRLLLSLCTSLVAVTLLLYLIFGSNDKQSVSPLPKPAAKKHTRVKAMFSFTSPASLFPPSAIISLTDDNSTFFLARPAAFGPLLPSKGLSGPLWVGSGFGDDTLGRGELGCSDVPGWSDGTANVGARNNLRTAPERSGSKKPQAQNNKYEAAEVAPIEEVDTFADNSDGTDDHLHSGYPASKLPKTQSGKVAGHADIQSIQENAEIAGKVVLLKRGGCGFLEKVKWAQRRGATALIVGDDVRGGALIRMYAHGDTSNVTIPALFTSHTTAHLLSSLLPTGGVLQDLSPEDAAKLGLAMVGKGGRNTKATKATKAQTNQSTSNRKSAASTNLAKARKGASDDTVDHDTSDTSEQAGWVRSFFAALGMGRASRDAAREKSRRPPSSGNIDWVVVDEWDDDHSGQKPMRSASATRHGGIKPAKTDVADDFIIGEQDWRDSALIPSPTSSAGIAKQSSSVTQSKTKGGSVLPGSGEYTKDGDTSKDEDDLIEHKGWFGNWFGEDDPREYDDEDEGSSSEKSDDKDKPEGPEPHQGLWVTLTPTNVSSSPFFDTLLVLVVSPLVTLTVVYALLLLRSRIRRRRWRAPKSVVERLPVRTYQTISDSNTSPAATPNASSPTTPLLQHTPSRPSSSAGRPRSRTTSEVPATSSSFQPSARTPEEEKREAGLAEWRRRYGGRQKECVVCLEEYVDGVSRVMSLPCGHEFHEECITPWLVTRRRTCPICKGDVVRSLSQSYRDRHPHSPPPTGSSQPLMGDIDDLSMQAAESRNDSPSASRPVPIISGSLSGADIEANWDDEERRGREIPQARSSDLSSSFRELSSTVSTTIWRGVDAIRGATGLQRRPSREEVDRDR